MIFIKGITDISVSSSSCPTGILPSRIVVAQEAVVMVIETIA